MLGLYDREVQTDGFESMGPGEGWSFLQRSYI